MPEFFRGALPSPRHRLAAAFPHVATEYTPPQVLWKATKLSSWGNFLYGDCTVAEEAYAKGATANVFVPDEVVIEWARVTGAINGDTLIDVLTTMQVRGFLVGGKLYNDGSPTSVNWADSKLLQNAIAHGPVKIGIAADQLQRVVPNPPTSGWYADGFVPDHALDHCVSLCGYGPVSWLAGQLDVPVPAGADPVAVAYAMFTWDSIGIITEESMLAITGEAWLREPTTVIGD